MLIKAQVTANLATRLLQILATSDVFKIKCFTSKCNQKNGYKLSRNVFNMPPIVSVTSIVCFKINFVVEAITC